MDKDAQIFLIITAILLLIWVLAIIFSIRKVLKKGKNRGPTIKNK